MIPLLVVSGPTASGKTGLAIELARRLGGAEIISADSRQVYRRLDIGTAKPTPAERSAATHHLIDCLEPEERFSAGMFAREAAVQAERLYAAGKEAIICGGTGFYIAALLTPMFVEPELPAASKREIRREHRERAASEGVEFLHRELAAVDPESAARLHPNDFQRVSRALELYRLTGRSMTELLAGTRMKTASRFRAFQVVLDPQPDVLKTRIDRRVDRMLESGWMEEVRNELARGAPPAAPGFQSLGYAEVVAVVRGEQSLEEARRDIQARTWQYARRQRTWFRRTMADIRLESPEGRAQEIAGRWRAFVNSMGEEE